MAARNRKSQAPQRPRNPAGGADAPQGGAEDPDDDSDEALLLRGQKQWSEGFTGNSNNRTRAAEDDQFLVGEGQWDSVQLDKRKNAKRPSLVVNAVNVPYWQITNDIRQNLPQIHFIPDDDDAHEETARVLEGMHRHMTFGHNGQGNEYRLQALNHAAAGGYGYYGMMTEYANERDFELELRLRGVANRDQVVDDPKAIEPDRRDRRYLFFCGRIPKAEFRKRYPHNDPEPGGLKRIPESLAALWDGVDVPEIEYWWRHIKEVRTISDAGEEDDVDEAGAPVVDDEGTPRVDAQGRPLKRARRTREDGSPAMLRDVVIWEVRGCLTNGAEILKDKAGRRIEWRLEVPWIPWFLVKGWEMNLAGEWHLEGAFHQAKDPQRLRNYGYSAVAEHVGRASKAGVMGPKGMFENFEYKWDTHMTEPWSTMEFNLVRGPDGTMYEPKPMPAQQEPAAAMALTQQSTQMVRDATGMYPVEQGGSPSDPLGTAKSPMLPGAMRQQRTEGDMNHYHFLAGLAVAMRFEADCFLWLAPKVYGGQKRAVRILGTDATEQHETVVLNEGQPDPSDPEKDLPPGDERTRAYRESRKRGEDGGVETVKHYNLNVGRYGVRVELGPSFATQREQTLTLLQGIAGAMPNAVPILAPFMFKAANVQDHEKLARAFMAMLPPNIQMALSDGQSGKEDADQLRAKLAQLMPIVQQLMQMNQQLQAEANDKKREQMIKAMAIAQKHVSDTLRAISHVTGVQIKSEADLFKDFITGSRGVAQRAVESVQHTGAVAAHAEERIAEAGAAGAGAGPNGAPGGTPGAGPGAGGPGGAGA